MAGAAFFSGEVVSVVLPRPELARDAAERGLVAGLGPLLHEHREQLERELGARFEIVEGVPPAGPQWLLGPSALNPVLASSGVRAPSCPSLRLDRSARRLVADAPDMPGLYEALSMLRSLRGERTELRVEDCRTVDEAIERVRDEVRVTWPSFESHGVDWSRLTAEETPRVRESRDPIAALQRWLARLGDAHTWVRPAEPWGWLPYGAIVRDGRLFACDVPRWSVGRRAGLRAGDEFLGRSADEWWDRTAASPHARSLLAGRRALSAPVGATMELEARTRNGGRVRWSEEASVSPWPECVGWRRIGTNLGYVRIFAWLRTADFEVRLDDALREMAPCRGLVVDLRGNGGGDLMLANRFRGRFLERPTIVGSIRWSHPDGGLTDAEPIHGRPADDCVPWRGAVRFLTDPLTYSASEDALLGLSDGRTRRILGERSGGGSGRVRTLRLLDGWRLTISSAQTFTDRGHGIEGQGLPVDREVVPDRVAGTDDDPVLAAAVEELEG